MYSELTRKKKLIKLRNFIKPHIFFSHALTGFVTTLSFQKWDENQFVKIHINGKTLHEAANSFMTANQNDEQFSLRGLKHILGSHHAG